MSLYKERNKILKNTSIVQLEEQQSSKLYAIEGIGCGFESYHSDQ